jgi:hypothetical protein
MVWRQANDIHSYMEPGKTSGCFQLLDQFFKVRICSSQSQFAELSGVASM